MKRTRRTLASGAAAAVLALGAVATPGAQAAPGPANTTLTVQKGGDRTAPQAVGGLAGATFDFFAGSSGTAPDPAAVPDASCTTTAPAGTCSVDVPGQTGDGQGYWIRERTAPSGFSTVPTLDVGIGSATTPGNYNELFTGNVQNNQGYQFPAAQTGSGVQSRGNFWADVRDNPALPGHCGLSIALLIDVSGSITPFLPAVKSAANGFVDALTGTPSSIALFSFADNATTELASTAVSDTAGADAVKAAIDGLSSGGTTNWDAGLFQIASSPTHFDAVLMLTDGNPTVYGPPPAQGFGDRTRLREIENGIFSANAVKAEGTKVAAVGVGAGVSGALENLKAISGPTAGSDYVQTDYAQLGNLFHELALRTCAGTVNVVKMVVPPGGTPAQGVPAGGWTFSVTNGNATPASGQTADSTGALSFTADLSGGAASVPVAIQETAQAGFTLMQNNGSNATCTVNGDPVTATNSGTSGFTVDAVRGQIVTCTVFNQAPQPPATVTVNKTWNINGTEYANPSQPASFQAALQLTDQNPAVFGQVYGGYTAGQSVTVGETIDATLLPPNCTNQSTGDLGQHVLTAGANSFTITNTVTCTTHLTLLKDVRNQFGTPAPANQWTLNAFPPGSTTPVVTGPTGAGADVQAGTKYSLGESTVAGYSQEIAPGAVIAPPATGTWHCRNRFPNNVFGPEFDGLNGTVTPQLGNNIECTAINNALPTRLTLHLKVFNTHGGTAVPSDWTLRAVPSAADLPTISGRDGQGAITNVIISAAAARAAAYTFAEADGPTGYERTGAPSCVLTGTDTPIPTVDGRFTPTPGDDITCTVAVQDLAAPQQQSASPEPPAGSSGTPIPVTGTRLAPMVAVGSLALMTGLGLLLFVRRRRWTEDGE